MKKAANHNCEIIIPEDVIIADQFVANADNQICSVRCIPDTKIIVDIGPVSIRQLLDNLSQLKTIIWNGPLGAFELKPFDSGTNTVAQEVARLTCENNLLSVAGGGDTMSALINAGVQDDFSYVSSAGGAFLEWIEGKELPGISVLKSKQHNRY